MRGVAQERVDRAEADDFVDDAGDDLVAGDAADARQLAAQERLRRLLDDAPALFGRHRSDLVRVQLFDEHLVHAEDQLLHVLVVAAGVVRAAVQRRRRCRRAGSVRVRWFCLVASLSCYYSTRLLLVPGRCPGCGSKSPLFCGVPCALRLRSVWRTPLRA